MNDNVVDPSSQTSVPMQPRQRKAFEFAASWHQRPEMEDVLWLDGVNLGEALESVVALHLYAALRDKA